MPLTISCWDRVCEGDLNVFVCNHVAWWELCVTFAKRALRHQQAVTSRVLLEISKAHRKPTKLDGDLLEWYESLLRSDIYSYSLRMPSRRCTSATEAKAPASLDLRTTLLLTKSHEVVELAADEALPHLVYRPRLDLEFASDKTSGSQTLLEGVGVFAAREAKCDAHVVDIPVERTHEGEPRVLC